MAEKVKKTKKKKKDTRVRVKSLPNERWAILIDADEKPIVSSARNYMISDHGRIKSINRKTGNEKIRKLNASRGNSLYTSVVRNGEEKSIKIKVANAVARVWLGKEEAATNYVMFLDGNKHNNHYSNLKWSNKRDFLLNKYEYNPESKYPRMKARIRNKWNERWVKFKDDSRTKQYLISDHGRAKSVHKVTGLEMLLSPKKSRSTWGYLNFRAKDGTNRHFFVQREVAKEWVEGRTEERKFVDHIDGDCYNNHYTNLRWVSQQEMTKIQLERGIFYNYSGRKLTETQAYLLKKKIHEGKIKWRVLAKNFGITETQVKRIARGENWSHIDINDEKYAKSR